jgi:hypothetical protein
VTESKRRGSVYAIGLGVMLALLLTACSPVAEPAGQATPTGGLLPTESAAASPVKTAGPSEGEVVLDRATPVPPTETAAATAIHMPPTETATATVTSVPPTETATASATPVLPTGEATPLPEVSTSLEDDEIVRQARQDLAGRLGVDEESISVSRVEAVEWPDASLGCPQPGMMYAQVVTPGYLVVLEVDGKPYEYHTSQKHFVLCEPRMEVPSATEPPVTPAPQAWPIPQLDIEVTVPAGFRLDVFAEGLLGPRFMALSPEGVLLVAERGAGRVVALPDGDGDGRAEEKIVVADNMIAPSSLAFHEGALYVGETTQITRLVLNENGQAVEREVVVSGLPGGRLCRIELQRLPGGRSEASGRVCLSAPGRRRTGLCHGTAERCGAGGQPLDGVLVGHQQWP